MTATGAAGAAADQRAGTPGATLPSGVTRPAAGSSVTTAQAAPRRTGAAGHLAASGPAARPPARAGAVDQRAPATVRVGTTGPAGSAGTTSHADSRVTIGLV